TGFLERYTDRILQTEMLLVAARRIEPDDQTLTKDLAAQCRVVCAEDQIEILTVVHRGGQQWMILLNGDERSGPLAIVAIDGDVTIAPVAVDGLPFRGQDTHHQ